MLFVCQRPHNAHYLLIVCWLLLITIGRCWSIVIVIPEEERRTRRAAQQELIEECSKREDFMQELHSKVQALQEAAEIASQVRVAPQDVSTDIEGLGLCPYASH